MSCHSTKAPGPAFCRPSCLSLSWAGSAPFSPLPYTGRATLTQPYLDDPQGFAGVVFVQVVDVPRQGDAEEVVLLPQAAQLLVQNVGAHGKRGNDRVHIDIPNFRGFVSGSRKQMGTIRTPADLLKQDSAVSVGEFSGKWPQKAPGHRPRFRVGRSKAGGSGARHGRDGKSVQAMSPARRDPEALCHHPDSEASNCQSVQMNANADMARSQAQAKPHTHSINASVVSLAASQCAHLLSRLPVIDVYLSTKGETCGFPVRDSPSSEHAERALFLVAAIGVLE